MIPRARSSPQSQIFFYLVLILVVFLTWMIFKPFLIFMVTGVLVAVLALPIDKKWEKILPNRVAAFGTMLTIFILIAAPVVGLGFALVGDVQDLTQRVQSGQVEQDLEDMLAFLLPHQSPEERNQTIDMIWSEVRPFVEDSLRNILLWAGGFLPRFLIALTVILFVTYYVLVDGERLVEYLRRAAPMPPRQVDFLLAEANNGLRAVFMGQILTSLIQGALGGILFFVTGVPGAVIWAALMAVLSLLPVVGAFLVWLPAGILMLLAGNIWQGIVILVVGFFVVSQADNFLRPKLIGNRARIHPIFILVGVLGGVVVFGFVGLFLGPLLVGILISLLKVWEAEYLDPDLLPEDKPGAVASEVELQPIPGPSAHLDDDDPTPDVGASADVDPDRKNTKEKGKGKG